MTDDDVEMVAKAIADNWQFHLPPEKARFFARAALSCMKAAGWRKIGPNEIVVPREPTDEIIKRIARARWEMTSSSDLYRAMVAAKDE